VSVPNILLIMLLQLLVAVACFALFATARQVSVSFYHAQILNCSRIVNTT
jgi:hypothetical protein